MKHPTGVAFRSAGLTAKKRLVQIALLNVFLMLIIPSLCAGTTLRVLDSDGNVGWEPSIAINWDGSPVISYATRAPVNGFVYLKVAFCDDAQCSSWTLRTVDSSDRAIEMTSIAIDNDGLPVISYRDRNTGLKVAKCNNTLSDCVEGKEGAWTITQVPSSGQGIYSSIAIGHDGLPVISYQTYSSLRVLKCGNAACSSGNVDTLLNNYQNPGYTAMAIGNDDNPVIAHIWYGLDVVKCGNPSCTSGNTLTEVDPDMTGLEVDIAIGTDGNPVISYYDEQLDDPVNGGDLKVAKCNNPSCGSATIKTVDSDGSVGRHTSIAIGADGFPVISYWAWTGADLRVAKCHDPACSSLSEPPTINTVDSVGEVGWFTSIAIGDDGPVITYYDNTNDDLKLALCSDPACTPPPAPRTLTVITSGNGTVSSDPPGINCGSDCSEQYDQGTVVTLTAYTGSGSTFSGWSGACSGTNPQCVLTMSSDRTATATFSLPPASRSLTVIKAGPGTVTSVPPGINCGSDCSESYTQGTVVTLTALADPGAAFTGWSGTCSGTALQCAFTLNVDTTVTATFARASAHEGSIGTEVTVSGAGFGIKKGKVRIGEAVPSIAKNGWADDRIVCLLTKVPPVGGPYDITITPYKSTSSMTLPGAFTVKTPEFVSVDMDHGQPGVIITVNGKFFTTKKGKVYIVDPDSGKKKSCKVTEWFMDPADGDSRLTFIVPKLSKSLPPGTYTLRISNKLGIVETMFTVDPSP
jgi:hypothetical protein